MGCVQFPVGARDFSLLKVVYMSSGTCPTSYSVGIRGTFSRHKAFGVRSWPVTSVKCWG